MAATEVIPYFPGVTGKILDLITQDGQHWGVHACQTFQVGYNLPTGTDPPGDVIKETTSAVVLSVGALNGRTTFDPTVGNWVIVTAPGTRALYATPLEEIGQLPTLLPFPYYAILQWVERGVIHPWQWGGDAATQSAVSGIQQQIGNATPQPAGTQWHEELSPQTAKAISLWNGSGNSAPPAGWDQPGFGDGSWPGAQQGPTSDFIWAEGVPVDGQEVLIRGYVTPPSGTVASAVFSIGAVTHLFSASFNGHDLGATADYPNNVGPGAPPALVLPGQSNLIALHAKVQTAIDPHAGVTCTLFVTYGTPTAASVVTINSSGALSSSPSGIALAHNGTLVGQAQRINFTDHGAVIWSISIDAAGVATVTTT